eukprot:TRINITY_DN1617_c0_g1_i1.p1 TRINITY_DN1617_c0_g1~~TRINITY_DN1617_c0_g1_i1.p1  ORF type:complete len:353 (+),score=52.75 TRINITY_DN1617_c0_g1_i1:89-1060(+)
MKDIPFEVRLDSEEGKDQHRKFKGTYFTSDNTIAIYEIKEVSKRIVVQIVVERKTYKKGEDIWNADCAYYYQLEDIGVGKKLKLKTHENRFSFVITKVDPIVYDYIYPHTSDEPTTFEEYPTAREGIPYTPGLSPVDSVNESIRNKVLHSGIETILNLGKHWRELDKSGRGEISPMEFRKVLLHHRIILTEEETSLITSYYTNERGGIDFEQFLFTIRGKMNEVRRECVRKAFVKLDSDHDGCIEVKDIQKFYSADRHPEVLSGESTEEIALKKFLQNFEGKHNAKSGLVSWQEFSSYYSTFSASIDSDDYFCSLLRNTWKTD